MRWMHAKYGMMRYSFCPPRTKFSSSIFHFVPHLTHGLNSPPKNFRNLPTPACFPPSRQRLSLCEKINFGVPTSVIAHFPRLTELFYSVRRGKWAITQACTPGLFCWDRTEFIRFVSFCLIPIPILESDLHITETDEAIMDRSWN